ncbi:glycosyltransferase family 22 protein [Bipolaris sorokiniana ND90Pr]|uniref:Mannosyltransferase n=1 Tax=Cochliobolus sativus (strain ND90Pr / ATCC 201652) TaxID=665912 RepID=M2T289_COCSN|nr:glycosyltransferase family 22 protein [Bipolaris sorokiniana ND90Pr]EMD63326.1 glycosyltransferase family 22 protein [Bipolaris sorokiniana ND90Pr]
MASTWPFFLLIPTVILIHLYVSPYTKVEESFNIQAVHDILMHGIPTENVDQFLTANYDHVSFPGSVPRTFAGAAVLSGLSRPFVGFMEDWEYVQMLVRAVLGMLNAAALIAFGRSVQKAFGTTAGIWYALFQASQFHAIYYASRTLPNMFAFIFSNMALRSLVLACNSPSTSSSVSGHYRLSLYLLTISGVVFRSELAILVATITVYLFLTRKISIVSVIIPAGIGGLIVGLICTVPLDSFFWQTFPLWPEWTGFYYNTIQGNSANWGVSPWYFYFANALPRLMLNPITYLVCIPIAVSNPTSQRRSLDILIPLLSFVAIYSFLPHKEWRFILYVIPGLTAVAADGAAWIWTRRSKSIIYAVLSLALVGSVLVSFAASTAILGISSLNYPGGKALHDLHKRMNHPYDKHFNVYFDNLACQTGVTRFLESHRGPQTVLDVLEEQNALQSRTWAYDKTEDPSALLDPMFWTKFDYVLTEKPERIIGIWTVVHVVYGFGGVRLLKPGEERKDEFRPLYEGSGPTIDVQDDWTSKVGAEWYRLEGRLRNSLLRGYWPMIWMQPKIYILENNMNPPMYM